MAKTQNAGAKMFADKIAGIAGVAMLATWVAGSDLGIIPALAILIFAFVDLTTGFCAACWTYGTYYKFKQTLNR